MNNKVVLAYSGGLETSVAIHWLRHRKHFRLFTFSANLGSRISLASLGELSLAVGAEAAHVKDLRHVFVEHYITPAIKANAQYESGFLATALSRPLITSELVKIAIEDDCDYIAHGASAEENDPNRFQNCMAAINPGLKLLAPLQMWPFKNRNQVLEYAQRHRLPLQLIQHSQYSLDQNLWGHCISAPLFADPWEAPPKDVFSWTVDPREAPDEPCTIDIEFHQGLPVACDGESLPLIDIINKLNHIGGQHGIGRCDLLENRTVGIKSREFYEAPAATILINAHKALEDLTLSKELLRYKQTVSSWYSELIYSGNWFSDLKEALDPFFQKTQENVTGITRMQLFKGSCTCIGRRSPYALCPKYSPQFEQDDHLNSKYYKIWQVPKI